MFLKIVELPHLKIPKEVFEDSLTAYLKAQDAMPVDKKILFMFVLTKAGQILDSRRNASGI